MDSIERPTPTLELPSRDGGGSERPNRRVRRFIPWIAVALALAAAIALLLLQISTAGTLSRAEEDLVSSRDQAAELTTQLEEHSAEVDRMSQEVAALSSERDQLRAENRRLAGSLDGCRTFLRMSFRAAIQLGPTASEAEYGRALGAKGIDAMMTCWAGEPPGALSL